MLQYNGETFSVLATDNSDASLVFNSHGLGISTQGGDRSLNLNQNGLSYSDGDSSLSINGNGASFSSGESGISFTFNDYIWRTSLTSEAELDISAISGPVRLNGGTNGIKATGSLAVSGSNHNITGSLNILGNTRTTGVQRAWWFEPTAQLSDSNNNLALYRDRLVTGPESDWDYLSRTTLSTGGAASFTADIAGVFTLLYGRDGDETEKSGVAKLQLANYHSGRGITFFPTQASLNIPLHGVTGVAALENTPIGNSTPSSGKFTKLVVTGSTVPSSATATGEAGQVVWDDNYVYICVATNTWKRSPIATW